MYELLEGRFAWSDFGSVLGGASRSPTASSHRQGIGLSFPDADPSTGEGGNGVQAFVQMPHDE